MEAPFVYGIAAEQEYFTDREQETKRLLLNFEGGINTIIISPRRWGKTSLVNKVAQQMSGNTLVRVVRMDAFSVRTQEDFYRMFATEIIRQTATRIEEWIANAKRFLSSLVPVVTMSTDPQNPVALTLKSVSSDYGEDVLNLPERIAKEKGIRIVVCIDEFQQIGEMGNSLTFQKRLRSVWQHQHSVSYCLYGSKRHLLTNMFGLRSYPFYKFGDVLFLERIPVDCWQEYIQTRFEQTGRHITPQLVSDIYDYTDGNSSYIQQLCWLVWTRTEGEASEEILTDAKRDLLQQNHALFMEQISSLTSYQIRFLRAIMAGKAREINRKETIEEFELGSSANVAVVKKSLQKKELIDIEGKDIRFADPVFVHWIKRNISMFV
ncbi:MAG: ATP-binding protein [Paludibacteraceae bacterium]|nr:ATP-binding protein [Paludibacteraceae bacterium]